MCGLCGIVHRDPAKLVGERDLFAMRDSMTHRGPDDAGHYLGAGVALGNGFRQDKRAQFTHMITILSQLDARFESDEFRTKRSKAAAWLAKGCPADDLAGEAGRSGGGFASEEELHEIAGQWYRTKTRRILAGTPRNTHH